MNVQKARKPQERVEVDYSSKFGIKTYGTDNLYPQNLKKIVQASGTATLCLNRYAKFIEGYGFEGELRTLVVNDDGATADDILHDVAGDVAEFGGFALHVKDRKSVV